MPWVSLLTYGNWCYILRFAQYWDYFPMGLNYFNTEGSLRMGIIQNSVGSFQCFEVHIIITEKLFLAVVVQSL